MSAGEHTPTSAPNKQPASPPDAAPSLSTDVLVSQLQGVPPFDGLGTACLQVLASHAKVCHFQKDDWIIKENSLAESMFIIYSGRVAILKSLSQENDEVTHEIARLGAGQTVGEMALVDNRIRSASVRSIEESVLIRFPLNTLQQLIREDLRFNTVSLKLAKILSRRLSHLDMTVVNVLQREVDSCRIRTGLASFILTFLTLMSGFVYFSFFCRNILPEPYLLSGIFSASVNLVTALCITWVIIHWGFSRDELGFHAKNLSHNLLESVLISAAIMAIVLGIKWYCMQSTDLFSPGTHLFFSWFDIHTHHTLSPWFQWTKELFVYAIIGTPSQEVLIRCYLQRPLERFISDKYAALKAILISNLLFSTFHTHLSILLSLLVFFAGLIWGWMYYRQRSIVGPLVSHILLGSWVLYIVGIPSFK